MINLTYSGMLFYKQNINYDDLLDFATSLVEKYSTEKEEDLIQIAKFKEVIHQSKNEQWLYFIEGWVGGLEQKYNESLDKWLRNQKLTKIKE